MLAFLSAPLWKNVSAGEAGSTWLELALIYLSHGGYMPLLGAKDWRKITIRMIVAQFKSIWFAVGNATLTAHGRYSIAAARVIGFSAKNVRCALESRHCACSLLPI